MTTASGSGAAEGAFLAAQREKLTDERARLAEELARFAKKDPIGADYHAGFDNIGRQADENALEEERYEAARSVEQSLEVQLREVNTALTRIADGTYGRCATCGAEIERARLQALPSAATCREHARP